MEDSKFGLEIETCLYDNKDGKANDSWHYFPIYIEKINRILRDIGVDQLFYNNFLGNEKDYDDKKWHLDFDTSISCSGELTFFPMEIVTPIINYRPESISTFKKIYDKVIINRDFVYEINKTQGLHINLSHPLQNSLTFLQWFWYFEPVIIKFLPIYRQSKIFEQAKPLRMIFPTFKDIEKDYRQYYSNAQLSKYSAVSIKPSRFEVRIIDPGIEYIHLINWTNFLVELLWCSITKELKLISIDTDSISILFNELFDYIKNDELKEYFRSIYEKYNRI